MKNIIRTSLLVSLLFILEKAAAQPGLQLYYPFTGSTLDASGNGKNGIGNNLIATTDRNGTANSAYNFQPKGVLRYLQFDPTGMYNNTFTYSLWVKLDSIPTSSLISIINVCGIGGSTKGGVAINLYYDPSSLSNTGWSFNINNKGTLQNTLGTAITPINTTNWYHLALVRDSIQDTVYMYVNGIFKVKRPLNKLAINYDIAATNGRIGGFASSTNFPGSIDDIRIFNRALTASEVLGLYNAPADTILGVNKDSISVNGGYQPTNTVTVNSNVNWSVSSNQSWIKVNPASSSGTGTFNIVVDPNTPSSSPARSGLVTVSSGSFSKSILVKQGVLVDSLNFSPKLDTLYLTSGATTNRKFDLASNRDWTISSNQSWCNVSPLSGIGNASFFISTATNPGATRIAKITLVSGLITRILYVNQTGGFFIDSLYVFADSIMRSAEAFPTNLIDIGCNRSWTASSNQSWATVTPTSGTNNGTINVSITANSGAARTAIITVTAGSLMRTVSIQQAAFVDSLSLSADSLILSAAASATNTIQVMSNKTWTVSSNQTWATVTPTSGNNNGSFNINIAANSGAQRTATITVTAGSKVKTVTVKQATFVPVPDSITLNMDTLNVGTAGGATNTIQVFSNTNWTISANQTWVTLSPTSGNNNGTFNINVAANTGTQRTATVTATAGTASKILIVNQGGLTAVEDVKSSFFSIYPNPVNDILHIDLKNTCRKGAISIFDVTGKEVMKEDVSKLIKIELDLSYLHRGMYFIQLIEDGNKHTSKLLVN